MKGGVSQQGKQLDADRKAHKDRETSAKADLLKFINTNNLLIKLAILETNSGIELELLKSALAVKGHSVNIQYLPLARTFHALKEGELDGIINTKQNMLDGVFYSDVVIRFQNCAISLKDKHFNIEIVSDLQDKSIVAFQRASMILGKDFTNMAALNSQYREQAKQIHIEAKRIENVPGTHSIFYDSEVDQIEIKHTAHSREGFALGAVVAAEWLVTKKGVFTMKDVLGLSSK